MLQMAAVISDSHPNGLQPRQLKHAVPPLNVVPRQKLVRGRRPRARALSAERVRPSQYKLPGSTVPGTASCRMTLLVHRIVVSTSEHDSACARHTPYGLSLRPFSSCFAPFYIALPCLAVQACAENPVTHACHCLPAIGYACHRRRARVGLRYE